MMEVITTHVNADFDCLGAMVAARRLYPEALMVFSGSQEKSVRDFFLKSSGYSDAFTRLKDIDPAKITRLILVDCQHASRIGSFAAVLERPGIEIHIFDHHPGTKGSIVATGGIIRACGSTTTILTGILMERGEDVSAADATLMMLGIYEDTGSLTFPGTSVEDYQAAAWLLERGARLNTVADFINQELTSEQVTLLNDLLHSLQKLNYNGIDVNIAHVTLEHYISDIAALAHMICDMEGLDVLFLVAGMANRVYLVGRSRISEVNAGEILREFGGGGHATAASATVREMTLLQVLEQLHEILPAKVNPLRSVASIMSSPAKSMPADTSLADARELLTRYNLNAMPVMSGDKMTGVISRQIVEKAIYHNLGQLPVAEYMHTEFMPASCSTPITAMKDYLVGHNRIIVPVFDKEQLVGVVTRTDLLRYMHSGEAAVEMTVDGTLLSREIAGRMKRALSPRISAVLRDLGRLGDELDLKVYAVGGFVRDLLLGQENLDIDITVEGDGIAFSEAFAERYGCRAKSHEKFGTAVILFPDGLKVDIASTRLEYYDSPGVLPTIERSSLKMDLHRRDFTINTFAVYLGGEGFGTLSDFFGGQRDLKDRAIRVLHNLSFVEDPTRVFRAIRFEQRLGFHIAAHTENLIKNAVRMDFLDRLGGKRFLAELVHIFREKHSEKAIERMASLGLLRYIHPGIKISQELRKCLDESEQIMTWFDLLYLRKPYERWGVCLLALCTQLGEQEFIDTCIRLAVNRHYREKLARGREQGRLVLQELSKRVTSGRPVLSSELCRWLKGLPVEILLHMMARTTKEDVRRLISLYFTRLSDIRIATTGNDLGKLGVPKGPVYREILDALLDAKLDGKVETKEDELLFAKTQISED